MFYVFMTLVTMIAPIIYSCFDYHKAPKNTHTIITVTNVVLLIIDLLISSFCAYGCGIYQQPSSVIAFNCTYLFIQVCVIDVVKHVDLPLDDFFINKPELNNAGLFKTIFVVCKDFLKYIFQPTEVGWLIILALFAVHSVNDVNTDMAMKHSARSIVSERMVKEQIPTLDKSNTPEVLSPKTVFYDINSKWSRVPHPNAYSIARNGNGNREIQAQYYHHHPVYVVPLQFNGHRYFHHYRTIPGYWIIRANDLNAQPHFIHKTIRYSDSSYFSHNVDRNIYKSHKTDIDLSDNAQLEIDEHGTPYYVETLRQANWLNNRANFKKIHVSVENAVTGKAKLYKNLNDTPRFIDENITSDVAHSIALDYGENRGGYWNINSFFMFGGYENHVMRPTNNGPEDDMTTLFHKGHIEYVTDMTTPGNGHSALGVLTVDGRTGHVKFYRASGMNDSERAVGIADRNFDQHKDWVVRMPAAYKIDGHTTWVLTITDSKGQIKRFYLEDAQNSNNTGTGATIGSALAEYKSNFDGSEKISDSDKAKMSDHTKGTVTNVVASPNEVKFMINGNKAVFVAHPDSSSKAVFMKRGDHIVFKANPSGMHAIAKDIINNSLD